MRRSVFVAQKRCSKTTCKIHAAGGGSARAPRRRHRRGWGSTGRTWVCRGEGVGGPECWAREQDRVGLCVHCAGVGGMTQSARIGTCPRRQVPRFVQVRSEEEADLPYPDRLLLGPKRFPPASGTGAQLPNPIDTRDQPVALLPSAVAVVGDPHLLHAPRVIAPRGGERRDERRRGRRVWLIAAAMGRR